jgi:hypothetical protein
MISETVYFNETTLRCVTESCHLRGFNFVRAHYHHFSPLDKVSWNNITIRAINDGRELFPYQHRFIAHVHDIELYFLDVQLAILRQRNAHSTARSFGAKTHS